MIKGKESSVKVGLRVRPLVSKENGQNITISENDRQSLQFKGQTFTFDHVFGLGVSQVDLYTETAAPMLKSFLEGYNCTIMAYGQTGSGKTYTMGTSDLNELDSQNNQGLIPRFVADLFDNLNSGNDSEKTSYKIRASFLEIYGEDVYDLIGSGSSGLSPINNRVSLPVREDEAGRVFVQGQNDIEVGSAEATLEVLCSGTHNRITASTAMNAGSSRSHAVFTLTLEQSVQSSTSVDDLHVMTSKLTFVDLAGSERIKRTGAEGQRMKEGIQINSGLFNLGQVINSLADEQKLKSNAKVFVPYRNSKLTHLLKDALGGNSQTLFLACVSPAESNESETQSTLTYARQARNIQNKPVKNVDKTQLELRRLKYAVKAWMHKAVANIFGDASKKTNNLLSPLPNVTPTKGGPSFDDPFSSKDECDADLLNRPDVQEFINAMNAAISDKLQCNEPSPRKVRLSMVAGPYSPSPVKIRPIQFSNMPHAITVSKKAPGIMPPSVVGEYGLKMPVLREDALLPAASSRALHRASLDADPQEEDGLDSMLSSLSACEYVQDPEETERLVSRMLDMVSKERDHYQNSENVPPSNELLQESQAQKDAELLEVETEIAEKEAILNRLMETVKSYATMKSDFEKLLEAIYSLENEKKELETELEQAKKLADATAASGNGANNSVAVERIRERFLKVQNELRAMKTERQNKESSYKKMCKESKQCEALLKDIQKLKENKVSMMKQSKAQALQFAKLKKDQVAKLGIFKKADIKKQQLMNTLKTELVKKERILAHKEKEISRMAMKLKASEDHITQLLKLQSAKNRSKIATPSNSSNANLGSLASKASGIPTNGGNGSSKLNASGATGGAVEPDGNYLASAKNMIEIMVSDVVSRKQDTILYGKKTQQLSQLNKQVLSEAYELDEALQSKKRLFRDLVCKYSPPAADAEEQDELEEESDMNQLFSLDFSTAALNNTQNGTSVATATAPTKKGVQASAAANCSPTMKTLFGKLNEDERYAVQSLKVSMMLMESNLNRLYKLSEQLSGDLDDLSLRMEDYAKENIPGMDQMTSWDMMSKDLVSGLTLSQTQSVLLDAITERCTNIVQTNVMSNEVQRVTRDYSNCNERIGELNKYVASLQQDLKNRLESAERQKTAAVWAVMNGSEAGESVATKIATDRANEFEGKWSAAMAESAEFKELTKTQQREIVALGREISDLHLIMKHDGPAGDSIDASGAARASDCIARLMSVWNKVGLPVADREEVLQYVNNAKQMAASRVILDAEANLVATTEEVMSIGTQLVTFCNALGVPVSHFLEDAEAVALFEAVMKKQVDLPTSSVTLLQLLDLVTAARDAIVVDLETSVVPSLQALKDRLMEMLSDMLMDIGELPASLQTLARLSISHFQLHSEENQSDVVNQQRIDKVQRVATQLLNLKVNCAEMPHWEAEIQKMNLIRLQLVTQLIELRDDTVRLSQDLGITELQQLSALVGTTSESSEEFSAGALNMAMQLIIANSASNPAGSAKLLSAIQRVKLVLDSVKVNRVTVCRQIGTYIRAYTTEFADNALLAINNREELVQSSVSSAGVFSAVETNELFVLAEAISIHALQMRQQVEGFLSSIVHDLTANNEDTVKYQIITLLKNKMTRRTSLSGDGSKSGLALFNSQVDELMEELEGLAVFVEEAWVQAYINDITGRWGGTTGKKGSKEDNSLRTIMNENWWLKEEVSRLTAIADAHKELVRCDASLGKHVVDMEEFEAQSKMDRAKALSGNSKLLIEEEKFRRNGKKKYETITDRMLLQHQKLLALLHSSAANNNGAVSPLGNASSGGIEIKLDLSALSASGQSLLKDRRLKERIELMHLNISAN